MGKLDGKVAVVTGALKGIGAAIAQHLAAAGAAVVVNYSSSKAEAEKVVQSITSKGGKAVAVQANMAKEPEIRRLFAEAKKALGKIDILVNNAGVYEFVAIEQVTAEHFHRIFDINVLGLLLASQEAAKAFGDRGGAIINISSVAADSAPAGFPVYCATKGAVNTLTRALANELGGRKIRVNGIAPGMVDTEGFRAVGLESSDFRKQYEADAALHRIGTPQDIAPAVVFLASDDSSWLSGETIHISGGFR